MVAYHNPLLEDARVVVAGLIGFVLRSPLRHLEQPFVGELAVWTLDLAEQAGAAQLPKQIAGVEAAFTGALLGGLGELPVVEAGAEGAGDGFVVLGAVVVA